MSTEDREPRQEETRRDEPRREQEYRPNPDETAQQPQTETPTATPDDDSEE